MRLALLADIHSNLAALEAVMEQVERLGVDRTVCLGDIVGYNAEPRECIELVRRMDIVVAGNHDRETLSGLSKPGTNATAQFIQHWTRAKLGPSEIDYLERLPNRFIDDDFVAVHGCYLNDIHTFGYVTSTMLEANLKAVRQRGFPPIAFCGHTHVAICGWLEGEHCQEPKAQGQVCWPARADVVLINPGSVGQPRESDPRAAFAVVDLEARTVDFHRVEYDIQRTVSAITRAGLPPSLGERLRAGR